MKVMLYIHQRDVAMPPPYTDALLRVHPHRQKGRAIRLVRGYFDDFA